MRHKLMIIALLALAGFSALVHGHRRKRKLRQKQHDKERVMEVVETTFMNWVIFKTRKPGVAGLGVNYRWSARSPQGQVICNKSIEGLKHCIQGYLGYGD